MDFSECLQRLTGSDAVTLSPTTVVRLKEVWSKEYQTWSQRCLANKRYVYFWVDGVRWSEVLAKPTQKLGLFEGADPFTGDLFVFFNKRRDSAVPRRSAHFCGFHRHAALLVHHRDVDLWPNAKRHTLRFAG